jgi:hypothetical protein
MFQSSSSMLASAMMDRCVNSSVPSDVGGIRPILMEDSNIRSRLPFASPQKSSKISSPSRSVEQPSSR